MSGYGYDQSAGTFSPDGRIFQVEYAGKAVENAGTAMGLKCSDGIVLCVEKPIYNRMMLPSSSRRIHTVDSHSGVAITGFVSDGRQIVNRARDEASSYFETYGTKCPPDILAERVSSYKHYFTLHGGLRPFGVSTIIASYEPDSKKFGLYMVEPSGTTYQYYGCAAGRGRQPAKTEMEKLALNKSTSADNINCREGVKQMAKIIYTLYEEGKDKPFELEMSWLCEESGWKHKGVPKDIINESVEWAKQAIADAEEEDDDGDDDDDDEGDMEE